MLQVRFLIGILFVLTLLFGPQPRITNSVLGATISDRSSRRDIMDDGYGLRYNATAIGSMPFHSTQNIMMKQRDKATSSDCAESINDDDNGEPASEGQGGNVTESGAACYGSCPGRGRIYRGRGCKSIYCCRASDQQSSTTSQ